MKKQTCGNLFKLILEHNRGPSLNQGTSKMSPLFDSLRQGGSDEDLYIYCQMGK